MSAPVNARLGWVAFFAIAINVFSAALDLTTTASVLPQLIFDFEIPLPGGLADATWLVNGYLIGYVVTMPVMGRVSDLYGRRFVFLVCLALFTAGSIWAALCNDLWWMVAARVTQALGGGAMVPVALAAVSDTVAPRHRPLAIGLIAAVDTAGWVAGASYGAWITTWLGWRWVFWLNVPIAVLGAILVVLTLPSGERREHWLDIPGALLLTLFLLFFTFALYLGAPAGPESGMLPTGASPAASPWLWPLLLASLLLLGAFFWWERRAPEPLIDMELLAGRTFAAANSVSLLTGIVLMAIMSMVPVLLQALSGSIEMGTLLSGGLLALFAGGMMAGALVAGPVLRLVRPRSVALGGLVVMTGGLWQMANWYPDLGVEGLRIPLLLAGTGLGLSTTPLATAVLARVSEEARGIASSLLLVARLLGMTIGLSVFVTWSLRRYTELMAQEPMPALGDPETLTLLAQIVVRVTTTVVTDLFLVTVLLSILALVPALLMGGEHPHPMHER